jgi:hypothetical protein
MLKYCGVELDPKSRTLLDYHSVEVARQNGAGGAPTFVLVRASELMSRAWMKDAADAHARDCPNIKRIINQFNRIGVGNSALPETCRCASACSSASSSWRTAAATCRTCTGMYAVFVGLEPVAGRAAAQGPLGD